MIFNINLKEDFNNRKKAMLLSIIPGLGQIYRRRYWGIAYTIIIILLFVFIFFIKRLDLLSNGLIYIGIFILYIMNIIDAFLGPYYKDSPCILACPANIDIPQYIKLIADKRFEEARAIVLRQLPFVSVCGTICPAPCQLKCVRNGYDENVMIMKLKKTLADKKESVNNIKYPNNSKRIAIIGGGVAGLSLAYFLSKRNIKCTIFEKEQEIGGLLRIIPRFRIDLLDILKDIQPIIDSPNIEILYNMELGNNIQLSELKKEYDFIIVAIGNNEYICPDKDIVPDTNVYHGLDILKRIANGEIINIGNSIAVIGGGNTAIDVARTMRRFNCNVHIYYRRSMDNMRASKDEIRDAIAEGVEIFTNKRVKNVIKHNDKLLIDFIDENNEITQKQYSALIYATGQRFIFNFEGINYDNKGFFTKDKRIFVLKDQGTIVKTAAYAKKLSRIIYRRIFPFKALLYNLYDNVKYKALIRHIPDAAWNYTKPAKISKINTLCLDNQKRIESFFKVDRDLTEEESIVQAKRCFDCPSKKSLPFLR